MASSSASAENVNTLEEFLGVTRSQAVFLLEKYVTVEQAVNNYFEDSARALKPQAPQNQWEPADNLPSFHIDAGNNTEFPAMSRPPSRVNNRMGDIGTHKLQAEAGSPTGEEMQDPDLERAIAMSKEGLPAQETGIAEPGQQFGPANRPYYDINQWAVATVASSREIVDHPPPAQRQRAAGQPAFLRGSSESGYLAPLLNIYHNIPLARERFLFPAMRVLSYGHDPQWWSGVSDENTKSISVEVSERGSQDRHNFLAELQCLMAFLDGTVRAYGSVDALADLRAMKMCNSETPLSRLLETWVAAAMMQVPDEQLTQTFTSTAVKSLETEGNAPIHKDLVCLEPTVRRIGGQTLTNMLDSTIWDDVSDRIDDIWIRQCAEIFTMRLYDPREENEGLGLEIPAVWYPDRYMSEYREITRQWRRDMLAVRQEINHCVLMQRRCEVAQGPGKRVIKIRDVLEAASKLLVSDLNSDGMSVQPEERSSDASSMDTEFVRAEQMQLQLQAILKRIDEKVKILEDRKVELLSQIKTIASQLTQPGPDPALSPRHKYYLQGVSTRPNITYIRRATGERPTLIDTTTDADEPEYQWWRIVWGKDERVLAPTAQPASQQQTQQNPSVRDLLTNDSVDQSQSYAVHVVDEAVVLEAAKTENNSIVLVYASENAMRFTPSNLSPALRMFVEQDNRAFREELGQVQTNQHRRSSQDTNTTIMEDILLNDRSTTPSNLREMTPMSITSPLRDADGQPSPKRPKADELPDLYRETDSSEDEPPPYEDSGYKPQMQEKKVNNKIGILADQMLEKYGGGLHRTEEDEGPVHIEHAKEPLR